MEKLDYMTAASWEMNAQTNSKRSIDTKNIKALNSNPKRKLKLSWLIVIKNNCVWRILFAWTSSLFHCIEYTKTATTTAAPAANRWQNKNHLCWAGIRRLFSIVVHSKQHFWLLHFVVAWLAIYIWVLLPAISDSSFHFMFYAQQLSKHIFHTISE